MKLDWGVITTLAGTGTLLLATELAKVIPGPDDQIIAVAGTVTALCSLLLQVRKNKTP